MQNSVRDTFLSFTEDFEGGTKNGIRIMFLDAYNRVGTAAGLDLDKNAGGYSTDPALAEREGRDKVLRLRWKFRRGPKIGLVASPDEVMAEWRNIKRQQPNMWWEQYKQFADLETDDQSVQAEVAVKLERNEAYLKTSPFFRDLDDWPADAQLGLMSMSWSGPALIRNGFPRFGAFCQRADFRNAALNCAISGPGSVARRNPANRQCFENAAAVLDGLPYYGFSKSTVYYPNVVLRPFTP